MRKIFLSLASKLSFYILTLTIVIFGCIALVFHTYSTQREEQQAVRYTALLMENMLQKIDRELARVENLLRGGAATGKQKDDIEAQIRVLESQLAATLSNIDRNTASINENALAVEAQIEALEDRISKCRPEAPAKGLVLAKYAEAGELTAPGKPLVKIADLDRIYLRAYFTSAQIAGIKVGDNVKVTADFGSGNRFGYDGKVTWISSESEFTPKTIQTEDSRANLVYAAKIAVKNDGRLKIGFSGEVELSND